MRPETCNDCAVRDQAVCSALDERALAELAALGQRRRYGRGETIFVAGDGGIACATLVSGAAKLSSTDADGTERIVALVHPAGFLGRLFAATGHYDVTALTDCELCLFPRAGFERLLAAYPQLAGSILKHTLAELDESRALTGLIGRRETKARLAGFLLALGRAASPAPCGLGRSFDLLLSREEMASLLGTTIETISRRITELEQAGLIERKGARGILIRDPVGLEFLAGD